MNVFWALLLAIPAGWGIGFGVARLIDRQSNMMPAITIISVFAVLALTALVPWVAARTRLRLMQGLALFGVLLLIALA